MKISSFLTVLLMILGACNHEKESSVILTIEIDTLQGISLLGKELKSKQPDPRADSSRISNLVIAEKHYLENPGDADALIWYGRRMAYLGDYRKAIAVFTTGIEKFPEDARMYRHRGHRYISLRMFRNAISDLEEAARLIEGTPDEVEPDGIPNTRNKPVSSLHNNIWYHLGLAYYLENEMDSALTAYQKCLEASANPDMKVAASNWLYMILRRMGRLEEAKKILGTVSSDMDVYENMAYHNLLLFYKEEIGEDTLTGNGLGSGIMNEAVSYGLGNWYLYNNNIEKAITVFKDILNRGSWAAFGYIAAEADLSRMDVSDPPG